MYESEQPRPFIVQEGGHFPSFAGFQRLGGEGDQGVTASEYKIPFGVMKYSKLRSW